MAINYEDYEGGHEDGQLVIPVSERVRALEIHAGLSRDEAMIAVSGGSEPAIDPAKVQREAEARLQVAQAFEAMQS